MLGCAKKSGWILSSSTHEVKYFLQTGKIITTNKSAGLTVVAGDDRGSYTTTVQVKYNPTALQTNWRFLFLPDLKNITNCFLLGS